MRALLLFLAGFAFGSCHTPQYEAFLDNLDSRNRYRLESNSENLRLANIRKLFLFIAQDLKLPDTEIRWKKGPLKTGNWAQAYFSRELGHFIIEAEYRPDFFYQRSILIHELAHVVAWDWASEEDPHGPQWGVAFSQVYQSAMRGYSEIWGSQDEEE
jgi:hypothetical protein